MKKSFKIGSVVLYKVKEDGLQQNLGMVLKKKEDNTYVILSSKNSVQKEIKEEWVIAVENVEKVREEIKQHYDVKIAEIKKQLRVVTEEEKEIEKTEKYDKLKEQIMNTARHMLESDNNDTFENKLRAIADLKKALFSIELESGAEIRKQNGRVKYTIKTIEVERDVILRGISDESIEKVFNF